MASDIAVPNHTDNINRATHNHGVELLEDRGKQVRLQGSAAGNRRRITPLGIRCNRLSRERCEAQAESRCANTTPPPGNAVKLRNSSAGHVHQSVPP